MYVTIYQNDGTQKEFIWCYLNIQVQNHGKIGMHSLLSYKDDYNGSGTLTTQLLFDLQGVVLLFINPTFIII